MKISEIKVPTFYETDPEMWFIVLEAQFTAKSITADKTKFAHVISNLNCQTAMQVKDILKSPYETGHYDKLKRALITIYAETATEKLRKLLSNAEMGDKKPSQFLHDMRSLADNRVGDDLIKSLWIQRLPATARAVLSAKDDDLDTLAKMADSMWEVSDRFCIAGVKTDDTVTACLEKISTTLSKLSDRMDKLERNEHKSRRDATPHRNTLRDKSKQRDQSESKKEYEQCWYHYKYGDDAKNCREPCKFSQPKN